MPSWGIHFETAKRINKNNKYDKNEFLFGNILPDVQDGYIVKNISNIVDHLTNHYYDGINYTYDRFCENNKNIINEDIAVGYLTHLLIDYYFNQTFYKKLQKIKDNKVNLKLVNGDNMITDFDKAGIIYKQHDFKIFERYVMEKYDPDIPLYQDNLVNKSNLISVININDNDIKNVIDYLENEFKNEEVNREYLVYTNDELEEIMENSEKFVLDYLRKIGI